MKNVHSTKAYDFIRKKILSGEYPPGSRLKTQELTASIGVSGTPVRDALRQLEADELVVIEARLGAHVKSLDLIEFKEMSQVRCALECLAAELAANNRTEVELAEMETALHEMGEIVEKLKQDHTSEALSRQLREADIRFHLAILAAAHNETLHQEVLRLHAIHRIILPRHIPTAMPVAWRIAVQECHLRILTGIRQGDCEGARVAMKEHIQGIADRAILAMANAARRRRLEHVAIEDISYTA